MGKQTSLVQEMWRASGHLAKSGKFKFWLWDYRKEVKQGPFQKKNESDEV
jgi:hypothetical protein